MTENWYQMRFYYESRIGDVRRFFYRRLWGIVTLGPIRGAVGTMVEVKRLPPPFNAKGITMRTPVFLSILLTSALPVFAQNSPPANPNATTPAITSPNSPPNRDAPAAGANSFTESQAKSRIEDKGFKSITELKKDDSGVWRGKAQREGKTVNVSVDFQGNVVAQ